MRRTLVISDIHGELKLFEELLEKVAYESEKDQLILLGDYVDRGPNSRGVVNRVIDLKSQGAIVLRGNHDEMMVGAVDNEPGVRERWERNGAILTLQSYDPSINSFEFPSTDEFKEHIKFLRELDYYYETDTHIFVHAGVEPGKLMEETDPHTFVWIREEFYKHYDGEKTVVFGHTPTSLIQGKGKHGVYFGKNNIIGIDGAAAYGGNLNCLELPSQKAYYTRKK
ncbi:metallophosphoesterase family protein [Oceanobacillus sp. CAU 1775]